MPNITLSVDEEIVRKVRKIAIDRNTTLSAMVREFLESTAARDDAQRRQTADRLRQSFKSLSRDMGPRRWKREDLYER